MAQVPVRLRIGTRELSGFRACGVTGFLAACGVALAVSADRDLSLVTEGVLIVTAVAVFLGLALATRAITGRETLTYYHHEIAVLGAVAATAWLLGSPVLAHLDATALGLGAFLACGRVGCTLAGCCHGRPSSLGIVYRRPFTATGFPAYLCDTPLVAVALAESLGVTILVGLGLLLASATPGAAFGLYVTGYAVIRFWLEELRGDPRRRYWRGLSEAQWTSLGVALVMAGLAIGAVVPGAVEHSAAAAALLICAPRVATRNSPDPLHPRHVRELTRVLAQSGVNAPRLTLTSSGIRISSGVTNGTVHHTLSRTGVPVSVQDAEKIAAVIAWLAGAGEPATVVPGAAGTIHLVVL